MTLDKLMNFGVPLIGWLILMLIAQSTAEPLHIYAAAILYFLMKHDYREGSKP